ncbi:ROK family protein [Prolixibacteraceae bacterium JC049]|nr:ROK family protein [Prolixibacteraceae bacterium JC049]
MVARDLAIGVDVGGSHISCATCSLHSGSLVQNSIETTTINNKGSKEELLFQFELLLNKCIKNIDVKRLKGIGIAMPGPFDYEKGIGQFSGENAKFINLNGVNLKEELERRLELKDIFIRFINDATAFAIGEFLKGKLQGTKRALAITLGTGLGAAFLANGIPIITGEEVPQDGCIWHLPFDTGIADDYFSTRGLVNRYYQKTGVTLNGVKELAMCAKNDSVAIDVFAEFGENLIGVLLPWLIKFGVETVVLGGNISNASHLFHKSMMKRLKKENISVNIEFSDLQESAAFLGSAYLLHDEFWKAVKEEFKYD